MISLESRQAIRKALRIALENNTTDYHAAVRLILDTAFGSANCISEALNSIEGFNEAAADIPGLYEFLLSVSPGNRQKSRGSFYTSPEVVRYMVTRCLEVYYENSSAVDMDDIKVFDPAAGCGVFLLEVARQLSERSGKDIRTIIEKHLYGCDIDPVAVYISKMLLSKFGDMPKNDVGNIRISDSLANHQQHYDIVIGNPPWISLKGRHRTSETDPEYIQQVRNRFGGDTYRPNVMEMFVRMAISSLTPCGINCFVVPDRLAANRQFTSLRNKMLTDYSLREIVFKVPFDGVLADVLIYILVNKPDCKYISVLKWGEPNSRMEITTRDILLSPCRSLIYPGTIREQEILRTMESCSLPLSPNLVSTKTGFIAPKGAISKDQISSSQIPVIRGRNIQAYKLDGCAYYDPDIRIIGGTSRREILEAHPKIFLRKTKNRFIAAICDKPVWPEQSVYQIWNIQKGYNLYFLLALLNSTPAEFYSRMRLLTNSDTTPQIKKLDLDRFPVPEIDFTTPDSMRITHASSFLEHQDAVVLRRAADEEILAGRSDVIHDAIADICKKICSGTGKKELPRTIDILVAALYRLPLSYEQPIAGLELASML